MSASPVSGGPAFPRTGSYADNRSSDYDSTSQDGMTLLDYFAAKAMQGMFANSALTERSDWNPTIAATAAYAIADAMLAAREGATHEG